MPPPSYIMSDDTVIIYSNDGRQKVVPKSQLKVWLAMGWSETSPVQQSASGGVNLVQTIKNITGRVVESTVGAAAPFYTPPTIGGPDTGYLEDYSVIFVAPDGTQVTYGELYRANPTTFPPPGTITRGEYEREFGALGGNPTKPSQEQQVNDWLEDFLGGLGGGGGRGSAGPTYVKPDERLVRDAVQARLVALTGVNDKGEIDRLTALYMGEDRRRFNQRETQDVDPMRSVQAEIEKMAEYKAIHQLRPESVDPMSWIADRRGALARAGVSVRRSDRMAIQQATVAATTQEAARAGQYATFNDTTQLLPGFFQSTLDSARSAMRLL